MSELVFLRLAGVEVLVQADSVEKQIARKVGAEDRAQSGNLLSTVRGSLAEWTVRTVPLSNQGAAALKDAAPHGAVRVVAGAMLGGSGNRATEALIEYLADEIVEIEGEVHRVLTIRIVQADTLGIEGPDGSVDYPPDDEDWDDWDDLDEEERRRRRRKRRNEPPVYNPPTAIFRVRPGLHGDVATVFEFDASMSVGPNLHYDWAFGDGTRASGSQVSKKFDRDGVYDVVLRVRNNRGTHANGALITVSSVYTPKARFKVSPSSPAAVGTRFVFDASESEGVGLVYEWDFGNGETATGVTAVHRYDEPGEYEVSLRVIDEFNSESAVSRLVVVDEDNEVSAAFTVEPAYGPSTTIFQFDASESTGVGRSFLWRFGDGATSVGEKPTHQYATDGTYRVELIVTDVDYRSATAVKHVIVTDEEAPRAPYTYADRIRHTSVRLRSDPYHSESPQSVHESTRYQVALDSDFEHIVFDSGDDDDRLYSVTVEDLMMSTEYWARSSHKSASGLDSDFGPAVHFVTLSEDDIVPPDDDDDWEPWDPDDPDDPDDPSDPDDPWDPPEPPDPWEPPEHDGPDSPGEPGSGGEPGDDGEEPGEPGSYPDEPDPDDDEVNDEETRPEKPVISVTNWSEGRSGGRVVVGGTVYLASSPLKSPVGRTHHASRWQLTLDPGFDRVDYDSSWDVTHRLARAIHKLEGRKVYYARVAHKDSGGEASEWSDPIEIPSEWDFEEDEGEIWRILEDDEPGIVISAWDCRYGAELDQEANLTQLHDARTELRDEVPAMHRAGITQIPRMQSGGFHFRGTNAGMSTQPSHHFSKISPGSVYICVVGRLLGVLPSAENQDASVAKVGAVPHLKILHNYAQGEVVAQLGSQYVRQSSAPWRAGGAPRIIHAYSMMAEAGIFLATTEQTDFVSSPLAPTSWPSPNLATIGKDFFGEPGVDYEFLAYLILRRKPNPNQVSMITQWAVDKHGVSLEPAIGPEKPTLEVEEVTQTTARLVGSEAVPGEPGAVHKASRWQVATTTGSIHYDSGWVEDDLLEITAENLSVNTEYVARVRYRDQWGSMSDWSQDVEFSTLEDWHAPHTPSIQYANEVFVQAGPFSTGNPAGTPADTHAESEWEIKTALDDAIIFHTGWTDEYLTSLELDDSLFERHRIYRVRVRYKSAEGLISQWSDWTRIVMREAWDVTGAQCVAAYDVRFGLSPDGMAWEDARGPGHGPTLVAPNPHIAPAVTSDGLTFNGSTNYLLDESAAFWQQACPAWQTVVVVVTRKGSWEGNSEIVETHTSPGSAMMSHYRDVTGFFQQPMLTLRSIPRGQSLGLSLENNSMPVGKRSIFWGVRSTLGNMVLRGLIPKTIADTDFEERTGNGTVVPADALCIGGYTPPRLPMTIRQILVFNAPPTPEQVAAINKIAKQVHGVEIDDD